MADKVEVLGIGELGEMFGRVKKDMVEKTSLRMVASAGGRTHHAERGERASARDA